MVDRNVLYASTTPLAILPYYISSKHDNLTLHPCLIYVLPARLELYRLTKGISPTFFGVRGTSTQSSTVSKRKERIEVSNCASHHETTARVSVNTSCCVPEVERPVPRYISTFPLPCTPVALETIDIGSYVAERLSHTEEASPYEATGSTCNIAYASKADATVRADIPHTSCRLETEKFHSLISLTSLVACVNAESKLCLLRYHAESNAFRVLSCHDCSGFSSAQYGAQRDAQDAAKGLLGDQLSCVSLEKKAAVEGFTLTLRWCLGNIQLALANSTLAQPKTSSDYNNRSSLPLNRPVASLDNCTSDPGLDKCINTNNAKRKTKITPSGHNGSVAGHRGTLLTTVVSCTFTLALHSNPDQLVFLPFLLGSSSKTHLLKCSNPSSQCCDAKTLSKSGASGMPCFGTHSFLQPNEVSFDAPAGPWCLSLSKDFHMKSIVDFCFVPAVDHTSSFKERTICILGSSAPLSNALLRSSAGSVFLLVLTVNVERRKFFVLLKHSASFFLNSFAIHPLMFPRILPRSTPSSEPKPITIISATESVALLVLSRFSLIVLPLWSAAPSPIEVPLCQPFDANQRRCYQAQHAIGLTATQNNCSYSVISGTGRSTSVSEFTQVVHEKCLCSSSLVELVLYASKIQMPELWLPLSNVVDSQGFLDHLQRSRSATPWRLQRPIVDSSLLNLDLTEYHWIVLNPFSHLLVPHNGHGALMKANLIFDPSSQTYLGFSFTRLESEITGTVVECAFSSDTCPRLLSIHSAYYASHDARFYRTLEQLLLVLPGHPTEGVSPTLWNITQHSFATSTCSSTPNALVTTLDQVNQRLYFECPNLGHLITILDPNRIVELARMAWPFPSSLPRFTSPYQGSLLSLDSSSFQFSGETASLEESALQNSKPVAANDVDTVMMSTSGGKQLALYDCGIFRSFISDRSSSAQFFPLPFDHHSHQFYLTLALTSFSFQTELSISSTLGCPRNSFPLSCSPTKLDTFPTMGLITGTGNRTRLVELRSSVLHKPLPIPICAARTVVSEKDQSNVLFDSPAKIWVFQIPQLYNFKQSDETGDVRLAMHSASAGSNEHSELCFQHDHSMSDVGEERRNGSTPLQTENSACLCVVSSDPTTTVGRTYVCQLDQRVKVATGESERPIALQCTLVDGSCGTAANSSDDVFGFDEESETLACGFLSNCDYKSFSTIFVQVTATEIRCIEPLVGGKLMSPAINLLDMDCASINEKEDDGTPFRSNAETTALLLNVPLAYQAAVLGQYVFVLLENKLLHIWESSFDAFASPSMEHRPVKPSFLESLCLTKIDRATCFPKMLQQRLSNFSVAEFPVSFCSKSCSLTDGGNRSSSAQLLPSTSLDRATSNVYLTAVLDAKPAIFFVASIQSREIVFVHHMCSLPDTFLKNMMPQTEIPSLKCLVPNASRTSASTCCHNTLLDYPSSSDVDPEESSAVHSGERQCVARAELLWLDPLDDGPTLLIAMHEHPLYIYRAMRCIDSKAKFSEAHYLFPFRFQQYLDIPHHAALRLLPLSHDEEEQGDMDGTNEWTLSFSRFGPLLTLLPTPPTYASHAAGAVALLRLPKVDADVGSYVVDKILVLASFRNRLFVHQEDSLSYTSNKCSSVAVAPVLDGYGKDVSAEQLNDSVCWLSITQKGELELRYITSEFLPVGPSSRTVLIGPKPITQMSLPLDYCVKADFDRDTGFLACANVSTTSETEAPPNDTTTLLFGTVIKRSSLFLFALSRPITCQTPLESTLKAAPTAVYYLPSTERICSVAFAKLTESTLFLAAGTALGVQNEMDSILGRLYLFDCTLLMDKTLDQNVLDHAKFEPRFTHLYPGPVLYIGTLTFPLPKPLQGPLFKTCLVHSAGRKLFVNEFEQNGLTRGSFFDLPSCVLSVASIKSYFLIGDAVTGAHFVMFRSNPDQRLATHAFSLLARSSPASILPATLAAVSVGYMSIGQTLQILVADSANHIQVVEYYTATSSALPAPRLQSSTTLLSKPSTYLTPVAFIDSLNGEGTVLRLHRTEGLEPKRLGCIASTAFGGLHCIFPRADLRTFTETL